MDKIRKIFNNIQDDEFEILKHYVEIVHYKPAEHIIVEGEKDSDLYILAKGIAQAVSILKKEGIVHIHRHFEEGEMFGELAYITGGARTLDVVAKTDVELVKISSDIIQKEPELFYKMHDIILNTVLGRIESTNQNQISSYIKERSLLKIQEYQSQILLFLIFSASAALIINRLIMTFMQTNTYSPIYSGIYLVIIFLPVLIMLIYHRDSLSLIGIKNENIKKSLSEGVLLTIFFITFILTFYYIYNGNINLSEILKIYLKPYTYIYLFDVAVQQLIRAYFQNNIHLIFEDKKHIISILVSAYSFTLLNFNIKFLSIEILFLIGIFFALLYCRYKNIYGLIILQFFCGSLLLNLH